MTKIFHFILFYLFFKSVYCYDADSIMLIITNNSKSVVKYSFVNYERFDATASYGGHIDYGLTIKFNKYIKDENIQVAFNPYTISKLSIGQIYAFNSYDFVIPPHSKLALIGMADRQNSSSAGDTPFIPGIFDTVHVKFSLKPVSDLIDIFRIANGDWTVNVKGNSINFDDYVDSSKHVAILNLDINQNNNIGFYYLSFLSPASKYTSVLSDGLNNVINAPYDSIIKNPLNTLSGIKDDFSCL